MLRIPSVIAFSNDHFRDGSTSYGKVRGVGKTVY
jgi:hypothetical protein